MLKKSMLLIVLMTQLIIFIASFITFTSTIKIFPWYEPLTMGAFFACIGLIGMQLFIGVLLLIISIRNKEFKKAYIVIILNFLILFSMIIFPEINQNLFYIFAIIYSGVEVILLVEWIKLTMKLHKN